jgi:hypothetical protein
MNDWMSCVCICTTVPVCEVEIIAIYRWFYLLSFALTLQFSSSLSRGPPEQTLPILFLKHTKGNVIHWEMTVPMEMES